MRAEKDKRGRGGGGRRGGSWRCCFWKSRPWAGFPASNHKVTKFH